MAEPTTFESSEQEQREWERERFSTFVSELQELTARVPRQGEVDGPDEALARVKWLIAKAVEAGWNVSPTPAP